VFDVPDGWRDTTTHEFRTPDSSGNLIVDFEHEPADATEILLRVLATYNAGLAPLIIYTHRIQLLRGNGHRTPAAEGEQSDIYEVDRFRFAIVSLTTAECWAVLRFLLPSSPGFLHVVHRIVVSAHFAGEPWAAPAAADTRTVQAGPLSLEIPADWHTPDTFDFVHPEADEVKLGVTVTKPMVPPGTVIWGEIFAEPCRILNVVAAQPAPASGGTDWEVEWQLQLASQPEPWIVRKAVTQVTVASVVTAVLQGPESKRAALAPVWAMFRSSLRPGGGR